MQDCCGAGRVVEAGFDAAACAWWVAGAITLGLRAAEASAARVPQAASRGAVVGLCWLSALMFLALLLTNLVLIKRLGRAYKAAAQQLQQQGGPQYPIGAPPGGVQMAAFPPGSVGSQPPLWGAPAGPHGSAPGTWGAPTPAPAPMQQTGPPPGYPTTR